MTVSEIRPEDVMQSESLAGVLVKAEIDQQIATARAYPRSISRFRKECFEMASLNEAVARECMYALPRKEKNGKIKMIEGPSARLAEIVASAWGNCRAAARVVDEGPEFVTAQGTFHDLERNVAISYEVRRRITSSNGFRYSADMISVTANAAASIALRNAVFKGVPKAFWLEAYLGARKVIAGDSKTLHARRLEALDHLQKLGATSDRVFASLGVEGVADIGIDELVQLNGIITAIKDGDTSVEEAFPDQVEGDKAKPSAGLSGVKAVLAVDVEKKLTTEWAIFDGALAANGVKPEDDTEAAREAFEAMLAAKFFEPALKRDVKARADLSVEDVKFVTAWARVELTKGQAS